MVSAAIRNGNPLDEHRSRDYSSTKQRYCV